MKKRVVLLIGLAVSLLVLIGCGSSEKKQGKELVEAVMKYDAKGKDGKAHFKENETNSIVYEDGNIYYVKLSKQADVKKEGEEIKYISSSIFKVKKHKEFKVSQSDIEEEFNEDAIGEGLKIIYEESNVNLIED